MNARELFGVLKDDLKLKKFLHIIEDKPKFPVFYDKNKQVLSLPPIINSETTKITMDTKNVLIEITATDLKKAKICLAVISSHFSDHCVGNKKNCIEPVEVTYEGGKVPTQLEPKMDHDTFEVETGYICRQLGIELTSDQMH